ncbi:hypothetical protein Dda_9269 [Drechslerella dactyloides]|uniref:Uncharacterized protein n=1 Tax=Drechslerella dactyloides TaxID=74499 RepID=A0AAD6IS18_DREDA|nr:hypothetical protein Dda_9269 [Drechslerella dactyloides]
MSAKPIILSTEPDLYLIITSTHHPDADIHLLVNRANICTLSRPLRKAYVAAVTHDRKYSYGGERYVCIKLDWWHRDALVLILKVLHHCPDAFPDVQDVSFKTFWGIPATLDTLQIELAGWFVRYFEYWKPRRLTYGHEAWLVVGKVFGCSEGYARLTARIVVEFTGWRYGGGMLKGPAAKAIDGGQVEMWEGWAPSNVMDHMKAEQLRLMTEILSHLDDWYRHITHLKTSRQGNCTCSPVEDCVIVGKALITALKDKNLIHRHHRHPEFRGSIIDLRKVLQPTEIRLRRTFGGFGYGRCKVYESMKRLLKDIDEVVGKVRGVMYDGTVEEFDLAVLVPSEMVLPWSTGQLGLMASAAGIALMIALLVAWHGLKALLGLTCALAKVL